MSRLLLLPNGVGKQRIYGPLKYFCSEKAACEYAVSYAKARLDRRWGTERKVRLQPALSAQTMPVWRRQTHRQIGRHRADERRARSPAVLLGPLDVAPYPRLRIAIIGGYALQAV